MRIFILTGAGVSAESGLGTFRDRDGLWTRVDLSEVATPDAFRRNPAKVQGFYNSRRAALAGAVPNAAHQAIARLQREWPRRGGEVFLCTQNVDDLHEKAGSEAAVHMHGELRRARCLSCGGVHAWDEDLGAGTACPACEAVGRLRPHIVWFGEMPLHMDEIHGALSACDLFVSIGTSGAVYPAAGFIADARRAGARTCELNLDPSDNAYAFDERRYGPATEVVPAWVEGLLAGQG